MKLNNTSTTPEKRKAHNALDTELFKNKAKLKHGEKYDYSNSIYTTSKDKIEIICLDHGFFSQKASNHLHGDGCPVCSGRIKTTEMVVSDFIQSRGFFYDYSFVVYLGSHEKVKIGCPNHGYFYQNIWQHMKGADCNKCCNERRNKLDFNELINIFNKTHKDKHDYSLSIYKNIDTPIEIICPHHGVFKQAPYHHRKDGAGCPICTKATPFSRSRYVSVCDRGDGLSSLYLIKAYGNGEAFYKIGITKHKLSVRFCQIPYEYEIIGSIHGDAGFIWDLEKKMHRMLRSYHYKPLIHFGGSRLECYSMVTDDVISIIKSMGKSKQLQLNL